MSNYLPSPPNSISPPGMVGGGEQDSFATTAGGGNGSFCSPPGVQINSPPPLPASYHLAGAPAPLTPPPQFAPTTVEMIPHRIFVGGFPIATTDAEIRAYFEKFGNVREVKLIKNPDGSSKGYGFVTFETEEEAHSVRTMFANEVVEFKGRKLNVGPAMRRMVPYTRLTDLAVVTPQQLTAQMGCMSLGGSPYPAAAPPAYQIIPGADYATAVPAQTPFYMVVQPQAPAYSPYPSCAYTPTYTPLQQGGSPGSRQGTPEKKNNRSPDKKSSSQGKGSPRAGGSAEHPPTPLRHQTTGGKSPGRQGSGQHPLTPGQTSALLAAQQHLTEQSGGPLTPITPGNAGQMANFRWAPSPSGAYQAAAAAAYQQSGYGGAGQQQQQAGSGAAQYYTGQTAVYPITDMTHYSQMWYPLQ